VKLFIQIALLEVKVQEILQGNGTKIA